MHRAVFSLGALLWLSCVFAGDKPVASAGHADVSIRLGNAWLDRGEYDLAISEYDKALLADPRAAMAFAGRGLAHLGKDNRELARQDLDSAAAIDPRNPVVPRARGLLALRAGNFTEAVANFSDSLALEPNSALSLQGRADAYLQSGDSEKALTDINAAIRHWPTWTGIYLFGANVLRQQGRAEEALLQADAVLAANPDNPEAGVVAARIYMSSGKDADAMHSLDRSLAIAPTIPAYLTRAGFRPKADLAGRRADAEAALSLDFSSSPARILLANVQFDATEYTDAVATLDKTMAIHGETAELLTWRGIVYARSDQPALAAKDFSAARTKATSVGALNNMCWNMATAGVAFDAALSACDAAIALVPNAGQSLDSRGFVLLRLHRYADAIAAYDAALKARAGQGTSLYGRGVAKHLKGDAVAGDADLKAALALDAHVATVFADYGVKP